MMRFASPHRLRPQVFSTSRRFDPPRACWPCFMPDPLMGFRPSELCSPRRAARRLRRRSPLVVERTRGPNPVRSAPPKRLGSNGPSTFQLATETEALGRRTRRFAPSRQRRSARFAEHRVLVGSCCHRSDNLHRRASPASRRRRNSVPTRRRPTVGVRAAAEAPAFPLTARRTGASWPKPIRSKDRRRAPPV
jgi:hypothetical protein